MQINSTYLFFTGNVYPISIGKHKFCHFMPMPFNKAKRNVSIQNDSDVEIESTLKPLICSPHMPLSCFRRTKQHIVSIEIDVRLGTSRHETL